MMKIPIKFRGMSAIGEISGYFVTRDKIPYLANDVGTLVSIDENTIAQLVGYDVDGTEVYEGDIVKDSDGQSYLVTLEFRVKWEGLQAESKDWTLPFEKVKKAGVSYSMPFDFWVAAEKKKLKKNG